MGQGNGLSTGGGWGQQGDSPRGQAVQGVAGRGGQMESGAGRGMGWIQWVRLCGRWQGRAEDGRVMQLSTEVKLPGGDPVPGVKLCRGWQGRGKGWTGREMGWIQRVRLCRGLQCRGENVGVGQEWQGKVGECKGGAGEWVGYRDQAVQKRWKDGWVGQAGEWVGRRGRHVQGVAGQQGRCKGGAGVAGQVGRWKGWACRGMG